MSSRLIGARHVRRTLSLLLVAAIAASALMASVSAPARAASDENVEVYWESASISGDTNGNGRLEPGDAVGLMLVVDTGAQDLTEVRIRTNVGTYSASDIPARTHRGLRIPLSMNASNTNDAGQGPVDTFWVLEYKAGGEAKTLTLEAAPLADTSSPLLTGTRTAHYTENHSAVDNRAVAGDSVQYSTVITNDTAVTMTVTDPNGAFADSIWPKTLAAGESVEVWGSPHAVTYNDMVAGGISWPAATLGWQTPDTSGTSTVAGATAATEAVNFSIEPTLTTVVHRGTSDVEVPFGSAVAGDEIDYRFGATNTGNVSAEWGYVGAGTFPGYPYTFSTSTNVLNLTAGASLPSGHFSAADLDSQFSDAFYPYVLTAADVDRGYVDLAFAARFAPTREAPRTTHDLSQRVYLRDFTRDAAFTVNASLNDANGDGLGQEGETVTYAWNFDNQSDQVMWIMGLADGAAADAAVGATLPSRINVARGASTSGQFTYTLTAADVARGSVGYALDANITGNADRVASVMTAAAPAVATGEYVAPSADLTSSSTYVDDNGDGSPSIGETVTFTVELHNTDTYPLTGIGIGDSATADVAGDFTGFPSTLGAGGTATATFEHVLTAEDFARGSVTYAAELTADGLATPLVSTATVVEPITFQSYAADLDAVSEGGVVVCDASGTAVTGLTTGEDYAVKPASCAMSGSGEGYRVVAFSTPMLLAVDSFDVTIPGQLGVGAHRVALYAPDGSLVGWQAVTVAEPMVLAFTGAEVGGLAAGATALTLGGVALVMAGSRRRR